MGLTIPCVTCTKTRVHTMHGKIHEPPTLLFSVTAAAQIGVFLRCVSYSLVRRKDGPSEETWSSLHTRSTLHPPQTTAREPSVSLPWREGLTPHPSHCYQGSSHRKPLLAAQLSSEPGRGRHSRPPGRAPHPLQLAKNPPQEGRGPGLSGKQPLAGSSSCLSRAAGVPAAWVQISTASSRRGLQCCPRGRTAIRSKRPTRSGQSSRSPGEVWWPLFKGHRA